MKKVNEGFSLVHRKEVKPSIKYQVIFKHKDKYSISEMCRFFNVSRSGYYAFLKRMDIPDRDLPLAEKIRECQEESHRTYGYRRVHIWLERQGIYRNPKKSTSSYAEKQFVICCSQEKVQICIRASTQIS